MVVYLFSKLIDHFTLACPSCTPTVFSASTRLRAGYSKPTNYVDALHCAQGRKKLGVLLHVGVPSYQLAWVDVHNCACSLVEYDFIEQSRISNIQRFSMSYMLFFIFK